MSRTGLLAQFAASAHRHGTVDEGERAEAEIEAVCYIRSGSGRASSQLAGPCPRKVPQSTPPQRDAIANMIEEALAEGPIARAEVVQNGETPRERAPSFDPSQALDFGKASSRRPSMAVGLRGKALRVLYAPVASPRRAVLLLVLLGATALVKMRLDDPRAFDGLVQSALSAARNLF